MSLPKLISAKQLDAYAGRADTVLIDLREPDLYRKSHLSGAVNYPFENWEDAMPVFPKGRLLIFYCEHGIASAKAAKLLSRQGYQTCSLIGGFSEYNGRKLVFSQ